MARKRSGRRRRKGFVAIPFRTTLTLGTLGAATVFTNALFPAFGEDFFAISADIGWSMRGHTAAEGPLYVGLAHGDYTEPEILENLQAELTDPDDKVAQEHSRRQVRRVGVFEGLETHETLNDGRPIRTQIKISIGDGFSLNGYAFNESGAALTTGTIIVLDGILYGRWQR